MTYNRYTIHDYATVEECKMHSIPFINRMISEGRASEMILVTEAIQEKRLSHIAEEIAADSRKKVVLLAGPSSSGKTSTSKRLCIQLMVCGKHPVALSMDNWYVNRIDTPLDENGKPDYETIHAVDLALFNANLADLIAGKDVALPTYNFVTGKREYNGEHLTLTEDMIIVIEGLHALNPMVSEKIPKESKYKIYAAPMSPISLDGELWIPTTVNRLLRRISRDFQTRGRTPEQTIAEWNSVRRGEEKWIVPFQKDADTVFDTSMLYELAALRQKAEDILLAVPHNAEHYEIVEKLLEFLRCLKPIDINQIPITSLLREFVGGSIFDAK